jgi:serine/threonine protein kinase
MPRSRFHILGKVGQGQFGRVFCAIDRSIGTLVALKDLDGLRYPTKPFLREIAYLISLRHPNIVSFQGMEHHQTGRYLVMDYCNGGTLRELMESGGIRGLRQGLRFILEILDGLDHAHDRGIVHCDIKPENILLNITASGWTAKITDFGISRLVAESDTRWQTGGGYTGSPAYMAPERFYGKYSPVSDLYAVGILLYELIVGDRPFSGIPTELMSAHLSKAAPIPDTIPESLRSIVETSLRKLPQRRFPSAKAMGTALREAIAGLPPEPLSQPFRGVSRPQKPDRPPIDPLETPAWRGVRKKLSPSRFWILDRRYAVAIFVGDRESRFSLVNRRGHRYGEITLPCVLDSLTFHPGDRYQCGGLENYPIPHAVSIGLKPFRVRRIPLDFLPDSIVCLDRGYRFTNSQQSIDIEFDVDQ